MNRILTGLLALLTLTQATSFSAQLNDVQAGRVAAIVGQILEGHHFAAPSWMTWLRPGS
ncbi:MAG: hypothetical protein ACXW3Z_07880 [Limisphaerales bacterium]